MYLSQGLEVPESQSSLNKSTQTIRRPFIALWQQKETQFSCLEATMISTTPYNVMKQELKRHEGLNKGSWWSPSSPLSCCRSCTYNAIFLSWKFVKLIENQSHLKSGSWLRTNLISSPDHVSLVIEQEIEVFSNKIGILILGYICWKNISTKADQLFNFVVSATNIP